MAQFLRPNADVTVNDWTTAPLWSSIDEAVASDTDFISSDTGTSNACEVGLLDATDPLSSTGHIVRYRYRKNAASGNARDITVSLYEGATLIAEQTHTGISEVFTAGAFTLTATQADAIVNYNNLQLRFTPSGTTGGSPGNRRSVQVSWAEVEIPDAPAAVTYEQAAFRLRRDDGDEVTATWRQPLNTNDGHPLDTNLRIRFVIQSGSNPPPVNALNLRLYCARNGGAYQQVNATSTIARSSLSPNVADDAATTQQLSVGSFSSSNFDEGNGRVTVFKDAGNVTGEVTETELCIQLRSADLAYGDVVTFQIRDDVGGVLNTYTNIPSVTIGVTKNTSATFGFTLPAGQIIEVGQEQTVWAFARKGGLGASNPLARLELLDGGVKIKDLQADTAIADTADGDWLTGAFTSAELSTPSGEGVEIRVVGTGVPGAAIEVAANGYAGHGPSWDATLQP